MSVEHLAENVDDVCSTRLTVGRRSHDDLRATCPYRVQRASVCWMSALVTCHDLDRDQHCPSVRIL
jgi:hypothetical protein